MKSSFINNSITLIAKSRELTSLEEKKIRYGLEGFYNLFTKMIVMTTLAIFLKILLEYLLLMAIYSTLRLYGFGIHMKTSLQCWFTTLPIYIGGCLIIKYVHVSPIVSIIVFVFGFLSFLLFAPADTPARPLIHKEKRIRAKILSLIILTCYLILFLYVDNMMIRNTILYGIILESIAINPLTYKLFRTPYNNYKNFK